MGSFESANSKNIFNKNGFHNRKNKISNFKSKLLTLKISHKIFDYCNFSLFCLVIIYSFIAFNSQKKWTEIYSSMLKIRIINNDLNEYIAKTEEYFINEIDSQNKLKKTTSKDLIYLKKPKEKFKNKFVFSYFLEGLKNGKYQRGY
tara:strand:- start:955 stop:1392 length:438 start_codon:yes stop_codon:yes gene_type:complete